MANGPDTPKATYAIATDVFLRVLGLCLLATFVAKVGQVPGLIGSGGITPLTELLAELADKYGADACWRAPTLFWLADGDGWLLAVSWLGLVASALLMVGVVPRAACIVCYVVYLSFRSIDEAPMRWFAWPFDDLLVETTFLAIFLAPASRWSRPDRPADPPAWPRWLLLWTLIRLMAGTGVTKVAAGGPWLELTALHDFLLTMPQPTATAMWCRELPPFVLAAGSAYTLAYELLAPVLFLWPGRVRRIAAAAGVPLMIGIWLCGNFRGLNLLTLALLLMLWDDASIRRWLPGALRSRLHVSVGGTIGAAGRAVAAIVITGVALASIDVAAQIAGRPRRDLPLLTARDLVAPFHLAAHYYMFCAIPTERLAIVLEGSADGRQWREYTTALPGPVDRAPPGVAPGHEYLAFPMWLGGFGPAEMSYRWLPGLLDRVLAGEPAVRALFTHDPFPEQPPKFVRTVQYRYTFASAEQRANGIWWQRERIGVHARAQR